MKKQTLIKVFSVVLLVLMLAPMVVACGGKGPDTDTEEKTVTLTLDAAGGKIEQKTFEYKAGDKIKSSDLPKPTKTEGTFLGWFIGETKVKFPYVINEDVTFKASWQGGIDEPEDSSDSDSSTTTDGKVTLTFDANGGTIVNGGATKQATPGKTFRLFPEVEREGYTFVCWLDEDDEEIGDSITVPNANATYTAYWKKNSSGGSTDTDSSTQVPEGPTVTVSLVLNGGKLADGEAEEWDAVVGSTFGKLPTPTRAGYNFLGWFEDGNEKWEIDRKTTVENYDMELHALWEAKGELVMVEFVMGPGETLSIETLYFEMVAGERISGFIPVLPTATKDGYKFKSWKLQDGTSITVTSIINSDTNLYPVWEQVILCHDGTENHQWNAWQEYSEASCTTPAQNSRSCNICGHVEYNTTQEATGHKYGNWATVITSEGIVRSRTCVECDDKEADPLENIAYDTFKTPVVDGDIWGTAPGPNLFDKDYEMNNTKSFAGKGTGAIVVTSEAKEATYVDMIAVTGYGSSAYNVVVTFENGDTKDLGLGSFGSGDGATKTFNVGAKITKIVITMGSCSVGSDYWVELSILVVPKSN